MITEEQVNQAESEINRKSLVNQNAMMEHSLQCSVNEFVEHRGERSTRQEINRIMGGYDGNAR